MRISKTILLLFVLSLCSVLCGQQDEFNKLHAGGLLGERVSIMRLVADSSSFEGKRVRIRGFLHFGQEESAIYLHKEDSDQILSDNAIWINLPPDLDGNLAKRLNDHYVNCEAIFSAKAHGHMGAFAGELSDVHWLSLSLSRAELDRVARGEPHR
jgi:hypothetical protein